MSCAVIYTYISLENGNRKVIHSPSVLHIVKHFAYIIVHTKVNIKQTKIQNNKQKLLFSWPIFWMHIESIAERCYLMTTLGSSSSTFYFYCREKVLVNTVLDPTSAISETKTVLIAWLAFLTFQWRFCEVCKTSFVMVCSQVPSKYIKSLLIERFHWNTNLLVW